jgi:pimeloyl-ACP methyl ester carboxylesterase
LAAEEKKLVHLLLPTSLAARKDDAGQRCQSGARAFFNTAANKDRFPPQDLDIYAEAAQQPGAMQSMVNYYRALVRYPEAREVGDAMVNVPTLVLWGENDLALDIHLLDGMEEWVPKLTVHRLPGISHWVQQDAPEEVNRLLSNWLETPLS